MLRVVYYKPRPRYLLCYDILELPPFCPHSGLFDFLFWLFYFHYFCRSFASVLHCVCRSFYFYLLKFISLFSVASSIFFFLLSFLFWEVQPKPYCQALPRGFTQRRNSEMTMVLSEPHYDSWFLSGSQRASRGYK